MTVRSFRRHLRRFERLNQMLTAACCPSVSMTQCHTLLEVDEMGEATTTQLAARLGLDKSTLSRTVDGLVQRGLIERRRAEGDRRVTRLMLTQEGSRLCDEIHLEGDASYENVLALLPESARLELVQSFENLVSAMARLSEAAPRHAACDACGDRD